MSIHSTESLVARRLLTLGCYVRTAPVEEDNESFEAWVERLMAQLEAHHAIGAHLEAAIRASLDSLWGTRSD